METQTGQWMGDANRACSARTDCTRVATIETDLGWLCDAHHEVAQAIMRGEQRLMQAESAHIAALAAKDAAISALKGAVHADVREFERDSATLEAQAEQIRVMREVLKAYRKDNRNHLSLCFTDRFYPGIGVMDDRCEICKAADAALASTAPVAEKKEGNYEAL